MAYTTHLTVALLGLLYAATAYWDPDLPPGPYCGLRNECCVDRRDECSHRILDSMCYCDEFCNHTRHDDCCPDYPAVCLGVVTTPPPSTLKKPCQYRGEIYMPGQKITKDCNECECIEEENGGRWSCLQDQCLISDDLVQDVNRRRGSWRAHNYTQFRGTKLSDGLIYYLGTLPLSAETRHLGAIEYDKDVQHPSTFDSRVQWPNFISPVTDQGYCGADWAVSLAGVVSDRFAIQSNGAENQLLSPQVLLSCNRRNQQGCRGGHIDVAWTYAKSVGLIDEDCFPYRAQVTQCPFKRRANLIQDGCRPANKARTSRYKVGPPSKLGREKDIMHDIMESGPVQAIMTVYQDFFHYRDGVYRHEGAADARAPRGLHAVRIVGWGEDRGDKFWIVANSWGRQWGENGYFRIARGVDEVGIESFVVSVLVEVVEANQRK